MESLSYLRWKGRRSLQKKREPWAFWPSDKKTLKFYDKVKEARGRELEPFVYAAPIRFEIELRGSRERNAFITGDYGFNYERWQRDLDHFLLQLKPIDVEGLSDLDCRILVMHYTGNLDSSKLTHRGKKSLERLDKCGLLTVFSAPRE